jgi:flavin reductase (DIM6/NTAB) family NADH-FMN oxidoreductase RutF
VPWRSGPDGAPVLEGAKAWFAGRILERVDLGDHHGFVLEPVDADVTDASPGDELSFQQAKDIDAGHPA